MENEIMNIENEVMVEDVIADGGSGIGTGMAVLIGAGIACAVGAGIKLAKKGINKLKNRKNNQPVANEHDFVVPSDEDEAK
jgi:hypothetical protein